MGSGGERARIGEQREGRDKNKNGGGEDTT